MEGDSTVPITTVHCQELVVVDVASAVATLGVVVIVGAGTTAVTVCSVDNVVFTVSYTVAGSLGALVGPPTSTTLYVGGGAGCGNARAWTARYVVAAKMDVALKRMTLSLGLVCVLCG